MKRYVATRGVSWRTRSGEVNRDAGQDVSDAPAAAIKDLLSVGAIEEVADGQK